MSRDVLIIRCPICKGDVEIAADGSVFEAPAVLEEGDCTCPDREENEIIQRHARDVMRERHEDAGDDT